MVCTHVMNILEKFRGMSTLICEVSRNVLVGNTEFQLTLDVEAISKVENQHTNLLLK